MLLISQSMRKCTLGSHFISQPEPLDSLTFHTGQPKLRPTGSSQNFPNEEILSKNFPNNGSDEHSP